MHRCSFAVADDELRPVMNGVCLRFTNEFTDFVASDGHKLVRIRKRPVLDCQTPGDVVLPREAVKILQTVTPQTGFVEMAFNEYIPKSNPDDEVPAAVCVIVVGGVRLVFKPIDGRYPNYGSVIPTRFNKEFGINRQALIKSFERLTAFANDSTKLITLTLSQGVLSMAAEDRDFDLRANEQIPCEYAGGKFRFGFKAPSMLSILKNLSAPDVVFNIVSETAACVITPKPQPDSEEITTLIMPMIIGD